MSCERYRKTLAGLAAGEPPSVDVDAHLVACAACRAELASLRDGLALADATLRELLSHEPSPVLAGRIRRAVAEGREKDGISSQPPWRWVWAVSSAGLLLLVAVAWQGGWLTSVPAGTRPELGTTASLASPVRAPLAAAEPASPEGDRQPVRQTFSSAGSARRRARNTAPMRGEPMVLVPPGGAEALQQFATELKERTVDPGSLLVADPMRGLPEPKPIHIEPLAPFDGGDRS